MKSQSCNALRLSQRMLMRVLCDAQNQVYVNIISMQNSYMNFVVMAHSFLLMAPLLQLVRMLVYCTIVQVMLNYAMEI
jgi:hypothetical protein